MQAGRTCGHGDCYPSRRSRCPNQLESQRASSTGRTRTSHQPARSSSQPVPNRALLTRPPGLEVSLSSESQPLVTLNAALRATSNATAETERERFGVGAETSQSPTSRLSSQPTVLPSLATSSFVISKVRHFRTLPSAGRAQEIVQTR